MAKLNLEEKITRLAAEFTAQLVEAVRKSSLEDLAALQSEKKKPGPKPGKRRGRKPGPKPGKKRGRKPGPKPGRKKPGPKPGSKRKAVKKTAEKNES